MNALNPVRRVGDQIAEPIEVRLGQPRESAAKRAAELLDLVGIPKKRATRLPARAVGRHAPARDDRDGPRVRPGDRHRRRADDRPRRHGPGPDPAAARAAPARPRPVADPDHARPVGDRRDLRQGDGDVRRPGGRGGARSGRCSPPLAIRTPRRCSAPTRTSTPTGGRSRSSRACRPTCATRRPAAASRRAARSRCRCAPRWCRPRSRSPTASAWPATCIRRRAPMAGRRPRRRPADRGGRRRARAPALDRPERRRGVTAPSRAGDAPAQVAAGVGCRRAVPSERPGDELLELEGLEVHFPIRGGLFDSLTRTPEGGRPRRGWHRPAHPQGRDPRPRRRVRLGQDDDRPRHREADAPDRRPIVFDGRDVSALWGTEARCATTGGASS